MKKSIFFILIISLCFFYGCDTQVEPIEQVIPEKTFNTIDIPLKSAGIISKDGLQILAYKSPDSYMTECTDLLSATDKQYCEYDNILTKNTKRPTIVGEFIIPEDIGEIVFANITMNMACKYFFNLGYLNEFEEYQLVDDTNEDIGSNHEDLYNCGDPNYALYEFSFPVEIIDGKVAFMLAPAYGNSAVKMDSVKLQVSVEKET